MTSFVCVNKMDIKDLCDILNKRELPITVNVVKGKDRTIEQNKLQRLWINEAVEQLQDETAEQKRGYCKLHFAVPILRNENDEFKKAYDEVIRPLTYEQKIKCMMIPLDFPCTRLMTTGQHKRYLDDVHDYFSSLGVKLTEPESEFA